MAIFGDGGKRVTPDNWDQGGEWSRRVYLHPEQVFPSRVVRRGPNVLPLPVQLRPEIADFVPESDVARERTLAQFLADSSMDGFIVVHRGAVVLETYPHMAVGDRHLIFSVTKAFVGTVLGLLEDDGRIDSRDPIERVVPSFSSTAWAGTSIANIADMASGMAGSETSAAAYTDPEHGHYQMEASLGWRTPTPEMPESVRVGDTHRFLETFARERPAGEAWVYTSANTAVLGCVIETVTGRPLAEVIEERIWSKIGAEQDALLLENRRGIPIAHGGLVMTLRDLARFGLQFTASGRSSAGDGIGPMRFMERILSEAREGETVERGPGEPPERYQWDGVSATGVLFKGGFGDQLLYVDTVRDVVIAYVGTNAAVDSPPTRLPLRALVEHFF